MVAGGPGGDAGGRKQMGSVEDRDIDDTQLQGGRAGARGPRVELSFLSCFFFFWSGHAGSMQKFPGQGWNRCHSSDNARSLTH